MTVPANFSKENAPIDLQVSFWNRWNAETREHEQQDVCLRQAEIITGWLELNGRRDLKILEVGCGSGWFAPQLAQFGDVVATDLSDEVLKRASEKWPFARFVAGDFMELEFADIRGVPLQFDVVVTLETLSHIYNQGAFMRKLARHLRPGGHLMLATQNREVLEKYNNIAPPAPGQLRRWVYQHELLDLLKQADLKSIECFTASPKATVGIMRWVNSHKLNAPVRALFGNRIERLKERMGFGWTLMSLSRRVK